jgi:hypothetical protein
MTDTRHKLEEAEYFLEGMKRNIENDKLFSFNLSAFVTSARSVSFIMQKQYSGHKKFSEWYKKEQNSFNCDNDFKFFNEMRVATVHTKALLPNKRVSVCIIEPTISIIDSVTAKVANSHTGKESFSQAVKILATSIKSSTKNVPSFLKCLSKQPDIAKAETNVSRN